MRRTCYALMAAVAMAVWGGNLATAQGPMPGYNGMPGGGGMMMAPTGPMMPASAMSYPGMAYPGAAYPGMGYPQGYPGGEMMMGDPSMMGGPEMGGPQMGGDYGSCEECSPHGGRHCRDCGNFPARPLFCGWYARAEALALMPTEPNRQTVSILNTTNLTVLDTQTPDFGYQTGTRVTIGKYLGNCFRLEGLYYGAQHWGDSDTVSSLALTGGALNDDLISPFVAGAGPGFDFDNFSFASVHNVAYNSELHNGEINLGIDGGKIGRMAPSGLIGIRYLSLNEEFTFAALDSFGDFASYRIQTNNNLIGPQLGGDLMFDVGQSGKFGIWGKAGFFANIADMDSAIINRGQLVRVTENDDVAVSTILEVGMNGSVAVGRHVSLVGGYQVVYVSGLALAPHQLDFTATQQSQQTLNEVGYKVFHGPSAGIQLNW